MSWKGYPERMLQVTKNRLKELGYNVHQFEGGFKDYAPSFDILLGNGMPIAIFVPERPLDSEPEGVEYTSDTWQICDVNNDYILNIRTFSQLLIEIEKLEKRDI